MADKKIDYKALVESGEIKTFSELISVFRKEVIDIYSKKKDWPRYHPTTSDFLEWGRIYFKLGLRRRVPFSIFVQIVRERTTQID